MRPPPRPAPAVVDDELVGGVAAAMALVKAFRMHGHLAAHLDPLGSEPPGDPALEPERLVPKLTPELQARIPASVLRLNVPGETLAEALPHLRETYCGTIAYEIEHLSDHEERVWLRQAIESGRYRQPLGDDEREALLARLSRVEGMEHYLRRAFLGQKQFSIEGLDVMVPMLDEAIELASEAGAHEVVIGMAHRGRLNVLAHVVGRPYETILREFEGERTIEAVVSSEEGGTGDVKYHLGAAGTRATAAGEITVTLASNPSHLEAVDPVVEGRARAEQTDRSSRDGYHDPTIALPILIHGDASFAGQGEVAETLNLARARRLLDRRHAAPDREQPGRLHHRSRGRALDALLERPREGLRHPDRPRERRRPRGRDLRGPPRDRVPAGASATTSSSTSSATAATATTSRTRPAYTQPLLAAAIATHPTVREQFAARARPRGRRRRRSRRTSSSRRSLAELKAAHERLKQSFGVPSSRAHETAAAADEAARRS